MPTIELLNLPTESCKQTLDSIIKTELSTDNYSCNISPGSSKGDNYIGVVYRVQAENTSIKANGSVTNQNANDSDSCKKISVIVKLPPENAARREQFFARPCFLRESMMYDEVLPLFMKFQESKGIIPTENGFYEVPKCYKTITDDMEEALFFEDLNVRKFEMFDRQKDATFEHVSLVMKVLGKLHAISYAIKDQKPDLLKPYQQIQDIFLMRENDVQMMEWFNEMTKKAITTLDPNRDKDIIDKCEKLFKKSFLENLQDILGPNTVGPYAVINHGDCWNNNILYRNKNGVPVEACLLDWQISRYASPVCDLVYYIFGCTTKELRDAHYNEFLQIYHKSLSEFLTRLGSNPEKLFSYSVLEDQLKKFGKFGLLMAVMVIPVFTSDAADTPDLDAMSEKMANGENTNNAFFDGNRNVHIYEKRMSDVIRHIYQLGYL